MATLTTNKNYLSPTGFHLKINSLRFPNLEYFATTITLPQITLEEQALPYKTASVTVKSAVDRFVLAHEIGHNFGCHHDLYQQSLDPEDETNPWYEYGYGHHIEGGYRTILAYYKEGFSPVVNYHSNPSVILNQTGTPTGIAGLSNNAYVITKNRFAMASNGDESGQCRAIGKTFLCHTFHSLIFLR